MADLTKQIVITGDSEKAVAAIEKAKKSIKGLADSTETATRKLVQQTETQTAAIEAGGKNTAAFFAYRARQAGVSEDIIAMQTKGLLEAQAKYANLDKSVEKSRKVLNEYGQTAGQTTQALRQVPAQFTDIFVSLASGQQPLTVLLQQGGQLKDVFGGVVPAVKAIGGELLKVVKNPYVLLIASLVAFIAILKDAENQTLSFSKAIELTGNKAGTTVDQLNILTRKIADTSNVSVGKASEALAALAASGAVPVSFLERLAGTAAQMKKIAGVDIADTVRQFADLGRDPVDAAEKLSKTVNFLSVAQYRAARAAEEVGDKTGAAKIVLTAYDDTLKSAMPRIQNNLGLVGQSWKFIADNAERALNAILRVGAPTTTDERSEELRGLIAGGEKQIAEREGRNERVDPSLKGRIAAAKDELAILEKGRFLAGERVAEAARLAAIERNGIQFLKDGERFRTEGQRAQLEIRKLDAQIAAGTLNITKAERDERVANINATLGKEAASRTLADAQARRSLLIAQAEITRNAQVKEIDTTNAILEARRAAGLVSERDYYDERRKNVDDLAKVQAIAFKAELKIAEDTAKKTVVRQGSKEDYEQQQKLAELKAKGATADAAQAAQIATLNEQQRVANANRVKGYEDALQVAREYLDTVAKGYQRENDLVTLGNKAKQEAGELTAANDRANKQSADILREYNKLLDPDATVRQQMLERLDIIKATLDAETILIEQAAQARKRVESDAVLGVQKAINQYRESSMDVFSQVEALTMRSFQGMEDSLVKFVTTGKLSFTDMANQMVADITRIIIKQQILLPLLGAGGSDNGIAGTLISAGMGALFGTAGGSGMPDTVPTRGGRALGGPVSANSLYRVNENGPELLTAGGKDYLMMGGTGGNVTANPKMGGNTVNVTVNQSFAAGTSRETTAQAAADAQRALSRAGRNM